MVGQDLLLALLGLLLGVHRNQTYSVLDRYVQ
jgi:hypothetical protein